MGAWGITYVDNSKNRADTKYSVIVPYWNAEPWIGRCCESLTKQDGDFEFILVNDSSTDNSEAIVNEYANRDARFVMINNERRKGVSGARNTGILHTRTEWLTFLDADDEFLDNAHETFTKVIATDKTARFYQLNHLRYYTRIDKLTLKYANDAGTYSIKNLPDIWWGVWNKLIRRDLLTDIRFDENLQYGEDGLFVLECMAAEKRLVHAERNTVMIKHRFDNKDSLSHVKHATDLIKQCRGYEDLILRQPDPDVRQTTCDILAELWTSQRFKELLGQDAKEIT